MGNGGEAVRSLSLQLFGLKMMEGDGPELSATNTPGPACQICKAGSRALKCLKNQEKQSFPAGQQSKGLKLLKPAMVTG